MKKSAKRKPRTKDPEFARRMRRFLQEEGLTQAQLVRLLAGKFDKASVSLWLKGNIPRADGYIAIGRITKNLEQKFWFFRRAGLTRKDVLGLAKRLLHDEARQLFSTVSDVIQVRRADGEDRIPFPREFVPDPLNTECVVVTGPQAGEELAAGDVLIVDTRQAGEQPAPFWDQVILVEFFKPEPNIIGKSYGGQIPENGLCIGKLRYKRIKHERELEKPEKLLSLNWLVTLGPCNDTQRIAVGRMTQYPVRTEKLMRQGILTDVPVWGYEENVVGLRIGSWQWNVHGPDIQVANIESERTRAEIEAERRVRDGAELFQGVRILGRVLGRFWPHREAAPK